jgi:hypothetical protein
VNRLRKAAVTEGCPGNDYERAWRWIVAQNLYHIIMLHLGWVDMEFNSDKYLIEPRQVSSAHEMYLVKSYKMTYSIS